jgi:hypothetical protein
MPAQCLISRSARAAPLRFWALITCGIRHATCCKLQQRSFAPLTPTRELTIHGPSEQLGKGRQRKKRKKTTYLPTYLFLRFFEIFRSDFRKYFYGVFGLLMQRNGQKSDKKELMGKDDRKNVFFFSTFSAKSF